MCLMSENMNRLQTGLKGSLRHWTQGNTTVVWHWTQEITEMDSRDHYKYDTGKTRIGIGIIGVIPCTWGEFQSSTGVNIQLQNCIQSIIRPEFSFY